MFEEKHAYSVYHVVWGKTQPCWGKEQCLRGLGLNLSTGIKNRLNKRVLTLVAH